MAHSGLDTPAQLERDSVVALLKPILEDKHLFKIGHDLKLISHVLSNYGISLRGRRYDTMLQSYVLNSVAFKHTFDRLVSLYLEQDKKTLEEVLGKGRTKISFAELELEKATSWSAENADFCFRLHQVLDNKLKQTTNWQRYIAISKSPWCRC